MRSASASGDDATLVRHHASLTAASSGARSAVIRSTSARALLSGPTDCLLHRRHRPLHDLSRTPRDLPTPQREQLVDQPGREAPDQQVAYAEPRALVAVP